MGPSTGAAGQGHQEPRFHQAPSMAQECPQIGAVKAEWGTYKLRVIWQDSGQCHALSLLQPRHLFLPQLCGGVLQLVQRTSRMGPNVCCSPWGHGTHHVLSWASQCPSAGQASSSFAHQPCPLHNIGGSSQ